MSPYLLSLWDEVIALYLISAKQVFNHTSKDLVLIKKSSVIVEKHIFSS